MNVNQKNIHLPLSVSLVSDFTFPTTKACTSCVQYKACNLWKNKIKEKKNRWFSESL